MELVIGGTGQGKLSYVLKKYGYCEKDVFSDPNSWENRPVFYHVETWIRQALAAGEDPMAQAKALLEGGFRGVWVCDEVGCGVVPAVAEERAWREAVGRLCCMLAQEVDAVTRVFCGLPMALKAPEEG